MPINENVVEIKIISENWIEDSTQLKSKVVNSKTKLKKLPEWFSSEYQILKNKKEWDTKVRMRRYNIYLTDILEDDKKEYGENNTQQNCEYWDFSRIEAWQ